MVNRNKPPVIYELNTWVWLNRLSRRHARPVSLNSVPPEEWDRLAALSLDTVWLMGVWKRSLAGRTISASDPKLQREYRSTVPDLIPEDVSGSPYSIEDYVVDPRFGGLEGLSSARNELKQRGLNLILDFVPNHVAPDHAWLTDHPEFLIQSQISSAFNPDSELFFERNGRLFAHGRDPYFPPWPDTAQLNAFHLGLRHAAAKTLIRIADQCDGVRCDMAMLLLNDIFASTWGQLAGGIPRAEYWTDLIGAVRAHHHGFLFVAEAYWDLERRLQQLGFDYCYDKRLYDRLCYGDAKSIGAHLQARVDYQKKLVRFLENHDEPRAAAVMEEPRQRAAATAIATLPGAKLYNDGQLVGNRIRLSVHLGRQPDEPTNTSLENFYKRLLHASSEMLSCCSDWQLCECQGWPDNQTVQNILAWLWSNSDALFLIVINFSAVTSQAHVLLPDRILIPGSHCTFRDLLNGDIFTRETQELADRGFFVDLEPWRAHVLALRWQLASAR